MKQTIIRYWHPRKGGWYYGTISATFRKQRKDWARVKPVIKGLHIVSVPLSDVREVAA